MNLTLFNNKVLLLMIILVLNIFMLNNNKKELMLMFNITLFNNTVLMIMLNTFFDNKDEMDLSDFYKATSPYVVTRHIEGTRNVKYYQCCSEPYIDLNFR